MWFSSGSSHETGVIFDIGSSSVGAGLVVFLPGEEPKLLYNTRVPMAFQKDLNFKSFFEAMLKALAQAAENIQKEGIAKFQKVLPGKVEDIYCVFSSPWYVSQTKILHYHSPTPTKVTKKLVDSLVEKFSEEFKHSSVAKRALQIQDDAELIEKRIIQIRLNGYDTPQPYEKEASEVEVSLFTSIVSKEVSLKVKEFLHAAFNSKHIELHSFSLSAFSAIRDVVGNTHDFLFFDIGGEVTDISLIHKGILLETISIPFGRNVLLRRMAEELKTSPEEALNTLTLFNRGDSGKKATALATTALAKGEAEWGRHLGNALQLFAEAHPIPQTLFLTAHDASGPLFERFMKNEALSRFTLTGEAFKVLVLDSESLSAFCKCNATLTRDPFLALEALFFNKLHLEYPSR